MEVDLVFYHGWRWRKCNSLQTNICHGETYHLAVVHAWQKDQWVITDDPLELEFAGRPIGIDLGAEKLVAYDPKREKIT